MPSRRQSESKWPATAWPSRRCWWSPRRAESTVQAAYGSAVPLYSEVDGRAGCRDRGRRPDRRRLSWRPTSRQHAAGSSCTPSARRQLTRLSLRPAASALRCAWYAPSACIFTHKYIHTSIYLSIYLLYNKSVQCTDFFRLPNAFYEISRYTVHTLSLFVFLTA